MADTVRVRLEILLEQALAALVANSNDRHSYGHGQVSACLVRALRRMRQYDLGSLPVEIDPQSNRAGFEANFRLKKPCPCREERDEY
ncbi:MAG TPA: hypothetical protein EYP49_06535 [Anaerolineae bacterium]|nr:hypothetical protein [Anaerolineae bacterium]